MTDHLLARLGQLLVLLALLVPLGLWIVARVPARPDLRWTTTDSFAQSERAVPQTEYGYGFSILLRNEGNAPTGPIEIDLRDTPADIRPVFDSLIDWSSTPTEDGVTLSLGPLDPDERARFIIYGSIDFMVDEVRMDGQHVPLSSLTRRTFQPAPRLPDWAALAGAFLLAGLALQNLALRRRLAAR
jgi:hypothetical protein